MFRKSLLALAGVFAVLSATAGPLPEQVKPRLAPITNSIVVTCHNQLAFVAVVFEDGSVTIYDSKSGVPAETALYTAAQAKVVRGYEACSSAAKVPPQDPSRSI